MQLQSQLVFIIFMKCEAFLCHFFISSNRSRNRRKTSAAIQFHLIALEIELSPEIPRQFFFVFENDKSFQFYFKSLNWIVNWREFSSTSDKFLWNLKKILRWKLKLNFKLLGAVHMRAIVITTVLFCSILGGKKSKKSLDVFCMFHKIIFRPKLWSQTHKLFFKTPIE